MKTFKGFITVILIPVAVLVWYEVFRLVMIEVKGSGHSYESSVVLSGVNQFTSQMGGGSSGTILFVLIGLISILLVLMVGRKSSKGK